MRTALTLTAKASSAAYCTSPTRDVDVHRLFGRPIFTWLCQQVRSKGVLTSKELSAIEPKRERCSCVFTCASERLGWVFCAADFKLAALASRAN